MLNLQGFLFLTSMQMSLILTYETIFVVLIPGNLHEQEISIYLHFISVRSKSTEKSGSSQLAGKVK
jgi:hypothetical protein